MQRRKIGQQRRAVDLYMKEDSKLFSKSLTSLETSSLLTFHFVCIPIFYKRFWQSFFQLQKILGIINI